MKTKVQKCIVIGIMILGQIAIALTLGKSWAFIDKLNLGDTPSFFLVALSLLMMIVISSLNFTIMEKVNKELDNEEELKQLKKKYFTPFKPAKYSGKEFMFTMGEHK